MKSKQSWMGRQSKRVLTGIMSLAAIVGTTALAQAPTPEPATTAVKEQLSTLKDKKKLAELGFEQGIGFIPYAGMGYEAFKTVRKDDSSPVRAAAAKQLARDPNPGTGKALVKTTTDKNWSVRAAALEAISQRGDRSLVSAIATALDDAKDEVRFAAAACVAHLSEIRAEKTPAEPAKP